MNLLRASQGTVVEIDKVEFSPRTSDFLAGRCIEALESGDLESAQLALSALEHWTTYRDSMTPDAMRLRATLAEQSSTQTVEN